MSTTNPQDQADAFLKSLKGLTSGSMFTLPDYRDNSGPGVSVTGMSIPMPVTDAASFPQITHVRAPEVERKLDALMTFLGLPEQVRAFITELAEQPDGTDTLLVFADWLEERRHLAAERMRQVAEGS